MSRSNLFSAELAFQRVAILNALQNPALRKTALVLAIATTAALAAGMLGALMRDTGVLEKETWTWFAVGRDYSIVETLGYIDFTLAAVLLWFAFKSNHRLLLLGLAILIAYLCIDDVTRLHDNARAWLGAQIGYENRFFNQEDFGELVFTGIAFAIAAFGFLRIAAKSSWDDLRLCVPVIAAVLLFLGFAVGFDNIHQIVSKFIPFTKRMDDIAIIFEDGGELLAQGLVLVACQALYLAVRAPALPAMRLLPNRGYVAAE